MNLKLTIAYDGTRYKGWQKTPMGPSIEAELQAILEQILQHPVRLQAASRTDAGVHAKGQVVNLLTDKQLPALDRLQISLNQLLPKDITVLEVQSMPEDFHPTIDNIGKEYHYFICLGKGQLPHHRFYSWHCPYDLDIEAMRAAAKLLVGTHDFAAFCNVKKNEEYEDTVRRVDEIQLIELPDDRLQWVIKGNHFLYKMVRNLVGTLVWIGRGKIKLEDVSKILNQCDRTLGGMTAPAHGLFLYDVMFF